MFPIQLGSTRISSTPLFWYTSQSSRNLSRSSQPSKHGMRVESVDIRFGKHCDRIGGFVTITRTYVLESIQNLLVILVGLMSNWLPEPKWRVSLRTFPRVCSLQRNLFSSYLTGSPHSLRVSVGLCVGVCVKIDQSSGDGVRVFLAQISNLLLRTGQIRGREIIE